MKRVVVTGLGMVSPLACGVEATWRRLLSGQSAVTRVENFDVSDLACQIAAQIPRGAAPDAFNPDDWMEPKEQRRVDPFIVYGVAAATQALRDADWAPKTYEEEIETGVMIGSGIGGLEHVPICSVVNLARALDELGDLGYWRIGLDSEAPGLLADARLARPLVLVLGAEDKGLRRLTRERCDALARLELPGAIKSLNVSNACAIALALVQESLNRRAAT
jgi:hypothetical protein